MTALVMPIIFAPTSYRQPQRRNPEQVDASKLQALIQAQVEAFRRKN